MDRIHDTHNNIDRLTDIVIVAPPIPIYYIWKIHDLFLVCSKLIVILILQYTYCIDCKLDTLPIILL